jgi:hypothetical protein
MVNRETVCFHRLAEYIQLIRLIDTPSPGLLLDHQLLEIAAFLTFNNPEFNTRRVSLHEETKKYFVNSLVVRCCIDPSEKKWNREESTSNYAWKSA